MLSLSLNDIALSGGDTRKLNKSGPMNVKSEVLCNNARVSYVQTSLNRKTQLAEVLAYWL